MSALKRLHLLPAGENDDEIGVRRLLVRRNRLISKPRSVTAFGAPRVKAVAGVAGQRVKTLAARRLAARRAFSNNKGKLGKP